MQQRSRARSASPIPILSDLAVARAHDQPLGMETTPVNRLDWGHVTEQARLIVEAYETRVTLRQLFPH